MEYITNNKSDSKKLIMAIALMFLFSISYVAISTFVEVDGFIDELESDLFRIGVDSEESCEAISGEVSLR